LESYASPVIYQPKGEPAQVIVLGAKRVDAYSVADGAKQWWVQGLGAFPVGSPVLSGDTVIVSTYGSDEKGPGYEEFIGKSDTNKDGRLAKLEMPDFAEFGAMDLNSDGFIDRDEWDRMTVSANGEFGLTAIRPGGKGDLTKTGIVWRSKKNFPTVSTPVVYEGIFYMIKSGGIIGSFRPETGELLKLGRTKEALEEHYASVVAADGKLFFLSESGKLTVAKAGRQWEVLAVNDLGEECHATPAIAGKNIYVRTKTSLYAFGEK
jgi:outer membrane protein assembly factor BamB